MGHGPKGKCVSSMLLFVSMGSHTTRKRDETFPRVQGLPAKGMACPLFSVRSDGDFVGFGAGADFS